MFLQGTEEIVCGVSFGYNLAPLLKEERKKDFKAASDRPFRMVEFYREVTQPHQLRRPAAVNRVRREPVWDASKGSRVS